MDKDQAVGALILAVSLLGIAVYGWLLFFTNFAFLVLQLTGFVAVAGILAIIAWIGYTMATTPSPKAIAAENIGSELTESSEKREEGSG
ncbi:transcriptional regulator [Candidatus Bathyarchaeota archaeon]|nr:transcriptional regulator [Candidatus Bathyarchaeota archaeon]